MQQKQFFEKCFCVPKKNAGSSDRILLFSPHFLGMARRGTVGFYRESDPFGELCNFYRLSSPIVYHNKSYVTSEHLYQALRFMYKGAPMINAEYAELVRKCSSPNKAKILSNQFLFARYSWQKELASTIQKYQQLGVAPREDWELAKVETMLAVLRLKFRSDEHCKCVLLSTEDALLEEQSSRDSFWGTGGDGKGKNTLGCLLMQVRSELKHELPSETPLHLRLEGKRLEALEKRKYTPDESVPAKRVKSTHSDSKQQY